MTTTNAILHVTPASYKEIRESLQDAGYDHALREDTVMMDGIALKSKMPPPHDYYPSLAAPDLGKCPDGGWCHHGCVGRCCRVDSSGPLSGVYPDDKWPAEMFPAPREQLVFQSEDGHSTPIEGASSAEADVLIEGAGSRSRSVTSIEDQVNAQVTEIYGGSITAQPSRAGAGARDHEAMEALRNGDVAVKYKGSRWHARRKVGHIMYEPRADEDLTAAILEALKVDIG